MGLRACRKSQPGKQYVDIQIYDSRTARELLFLKHCEVVLYSRLNSSVNNWLNNLLSKVSVNHSALLSSWLSQQGPQGWPSEGLLKHRLLGFGLSCVLLSRVCLKSVYLWYISRHCWYDSRTRIWEAGKQTVAALGSAALGAAYSLGLSLLTILHQLEWLTLTSTISLTLTPRCKFFPSFIFFLVLPHEQLTKGLTSL